MAGLYQPREGTKGSLEKIYVLSFSFSFLFQYSNFNLYAYDMQDMCFLNALYWKGNIISAHIPWVRTSHLVTHTCRKAGICLTAQRPSNYSCAVACISCNVVHAIAWEEVSRFLWRVAVSAQITNTYLIFTVCFYIISPFYHMPFYLYSNSL